MAIQIDIKNYGGRDLIEGIVKNYYSKLGNSKPTTPHIIPSIARRKVVERMPLNEGFIITLEYAQYNKNQMMMATYYTIYNMKKGRIDTSAPKTYDMSKRLSIKKVNNYGFSEHCKNWNNMQKRINEIGSVC